MKIGQSLVIVLSVLGVGTVSAYATKADQILLSCATINGKTLQVSNNNAKIRHTLYDHTQKAELDFIVPHHATKYRLWQGLATMHSLILPYDGREYVVFTSMDKFGKNNKTGVRIIKGDKLLATLRCDNNKIRINELDKLSGITSIAKYQAPKN